MLLDNVTKYWKNRHHLDDLRAGPEHTMFRKGDRPEVPEDALGVYSFPTEQQLSLPIIDDATAWQLVAEVTNGPQAWKEWKEKGNLIADVFSWLWEGVEVDGVWESGIGDRLTFSR